MNRPIIEIEKDIRNYFLPRPKYIAGDGKVFYKKKEWDKYIKKNKEEIPF